MAYEVLARKWRPQVFEEVIGQDHITRTLRNAIKADRLAHAYLFSGSRGVGKTSVARILAKAINCREGEPDVPCNHCQSCVEITNGSSVDVQEIDGASNRGIDEIRLLRDNIKYMPSSGRYRVYIIDEVHMLTLPAFNALLKTLEEPPSHVKFIFATTEPHKVPVTILSRCQRFDFKRIPTGKILEHLEKVARDEAIGISRTGMGLIAREAKGSMRDAESLLDQVVSYTGPKVEDKDITDILGIIDASLILETSQAIIGGSAQRCLEIVDRIYHYGHDLKEFYRAIMDQFRNMLVSLVVPGDDMLDMIPSEVEEVKRQAKAAGMERLQQSLNYLIAREQDIRFTFQPRLVLETVLIKLCRLGEDLSFDQLIKKIEALEGRLGSSFTGGPACSPIQVSEPDKGWAGRERGTPEDRAFPGEEGTPRWEAFLDFLSTKSTSMANVLKEWRFVKLDRDVLEMAKGKNSFSSSYFDDPDRMEKLLAHCREFFKRDIKIKVTEQEKRESSTAASQDPAPEARKSNEQEDVPPHVNDVLKIFQGKIMGDIPSGENQKKE
ncbi:MAG: DNA polymerase III subunit gamma/tau [Deltaproteobacteria bacterium]|nr:DNA polymerase III subunit gamma/tau [Deltaproteobacteria bacterium]MBW2136481.1 DNA polymerase III subunit gamma/tau [Deltaproteobacteria bacterium]